MLKKHVTKDYIKLVKILCKFRIGYDTYVDVLKKISRELGIFIFSSMVEGF